MISQRLKSADEPAPAARAAADDAATGTPPTQASGDETPTASAAGVPPAQVSAAGPVP
jgi:hypothetical protein